MSLVEQTCGAVTDDIKGKIFGHVNSAVVCENKITNQDSHLIPSVKHSGDGVMIWACSAATRPGRLAAIEYHQLFSLSKYIGVKYEAICPNIKA